MREIGEECPEVRHSYGFGRIAGYLETKMNCLPTLRTGSPTLDTAFRIAVGDFLGNIQPWKGECANAATPCILAGLDYDKPWTRDAAFNSWFAGNLLAPTVARNTLLAVLMEDRRGLRIGGQYWDSIIWVTGAWDHYLCTGDADFLARAFGVATHSMSFFEETEFDFQDGLFRGGACFQDGIAGYPDRFADSPRSSCVLDWVRQHPEEKAATGYGLPMKALSTNCLYYNTYGILYLMAQELKVSGDPEWMARARRLRNAINRSFWCPELGTYRYLVDAGDTVDRQEGLGNAFAVLFGVADEGQAKSIFENQPITKHGIPCVWPGYERYVNANGTSFGRHSGTVWPQVETVWAMAASQHGRADIAWFELRSLARKACRDGQFAEIYHPLTGMIYGGMQERPPVSDCPVRWSAGRRQTWCATGYVQMILSALFGTRLSPTGLTFTPHLPAELDHAALSELHYRNAVVNLVVKRSDKGYCAMVNSIKQDQAHIPADASGLFHIVVEIPDRPRTDTERKADAGADN